MISRVFFKAWPAANEVRLLEGLDELGTQNWRSTDSSSMSRPLQDGTIAVSTETPGWFGRLPCDSQNRRTWCFLVLRVSLPGPTGTFLHPVAGRWPQLFRLKTMQHACAELCDFIQWPRNPAGMKVVRKNRREVRSLKNPCGAPNFDKFWGLDVFGFQDVTFGAPFFWSKKSSQVEAAIPGLGGAMPDGHVRGVDDVNGTEKKPRRCGLFWCWTHHPNVTKSAFQHFLVQFLSSGFRQES